jgi:hypothetical protein
MIMRKNILLLLLAIAVTAIIFVIARINSNHPAVTSAHSPSASLFSDEANKIFVSSIAGNVDLNSGITMDGPTPVVIPDQINNIDFAVFNHTDEPILFHNQGFGLTVFRYDEIAKKWENLPLQYVPHAEPTILPPRLETRYSDVSNSWHILEDETTSWGYKQIRIYVCGNGQMTNKTYGAYMDVSIHLP